MNQKTLFEDDDDDWKGFSEAMKAHSQEKRASHLENSVRLLAELGIDFTSSNQCVHCIIVDHGATWDFWPSTGKWAKRGKNSQYKRGVFPLLQDINNARPESARLSAASLRSAGQPVRQEPPPTGGDVANGQGPDSDPNP